MKFIIRNTFGLQVTVIHPQLSMDRNSLDVEQSGETVLEELGHQATLEDLATDEDNTVIEPAELGRWAP